MSPVAPSSSLISVVSVLPTVGVPTIVTAPSEFTRPTGSVGVDIGASSKPRSSVNVADTVITLPNSFSVRVSVDVTSFSIATSSANHT